MKHAGRLDRAGWSDRCFTWNTSKAGTSPVGLPTRTRPPASEVRGRYELGSIGSRQAAVDKSTARSRVGLPPRREPKFGRGATWTRQVRADGHPGIRPFAALGAGPRQRVPRETTGSRPHQRPRSSPENPVPAGQRGQRQRTRERNVAVPGTSLRRRPLPRQHHARVTSPLRSTRTPAGECPPAPGDRKRTGRRSPGPPVRPSLADLANEPGVRHLPDPVCHSPPDFRRA